MAGKEIKVSVIVPVYNVEKYLKECVNSLIGQTLKDIEILLIDDGSTDSSGNICDEYEKKHPNIKVIHKVNEGQGKARNIAISLVEGKYVYYMDSDDILEQDALRYLSDEADSKKLDVILFAAECFSDEENIIYNSEIYKRTKCLNEIKSGNDMFESLYYAKEYNCSIPMRFYNREYLIENNFQFPLNIIHEDELFGFYSLIKAKRVECVSFQFYKRRFRTGSTMTSKKAYKSAMGYLYTWKSLMNVCQDIESEKQKVYWDFTQSFLKLIMNLYYGCFNKDEKNELKKARYEIRNILGTDIKNVEKGIRLFLINPTLYKLYRNISRVARQKF